MSTQLKDLQSIEQIISEMTLEEKALLVTGGSGFGSQPMEKYGIPRVVLLDGATGFNSMQWNSEQFFFKAEKEAEEAGTPLDRETFDGMGGLYIGMAGMMKAAEEAAASGVPQEKTPLDFGVYPPGMFLGSTWKPEAAEACGKSLGDEMGSHGIDVILGPNVNIHRDPLAGRAFEGYSEDPFLMGKMGSAMIRGIQSTGVAADAKHYAANSQETNRFGIDEKISERAMREIYLPGFKACVKEGKVKTIMSAYNKVFGKDCAMNPWLLTKVLRDEWNFDGFVVSDWSAAYDQVEAVAAGNDLAMPGPRGIKVLIDAVNEGRLEEAALDKAIRNFLKVVLELPVFTGKRPTFTKEEAVAATEAAAKEGIVLLKNEGVLPLSGSEKIAFYGKRSTAFVASGAGSAGVDSDWLTNPVDCMKAMIGAENVTVGEAAADTKIWIATVGANGQEGQDRLTMDMDPDDAEALEKAIAEAKAADGKVILLLNTAGPVSLMPYVYRVDAVVCAFFPGMMGGKAIAEVLLGKVNPSGKLPLSWPKEYRDCPTYRNFPGEEMEVWYGEGIYVGYRYYDTKKVAPLYAFGYGQSYTTFEITNVEAPEAVDVDAENLKLKVTVRNTGSVDGSEVVQVYVHDVVSRIPKPEKELKGFAKVFVKAGAEETVEIEIGKEQLSSWSVLLNEWACEPGDFDIMVGNSSDNIQVVKRVAVSCKNPFAVTFNTGIGETVADARAVDVINSAIGGNIVQIANMAIVFFPAHSLESVFTSMVVPFLKEQGKNAEEIAAAHDTIEKGLAAI